MRLKAESEDEVEEPGRSGMLKATAIALLGGGVPFSLALLRLGPDMASPELLRYALIASAPLCIVVIAAGLQLGSSKLVVLFSQICICAIAASVPLEVLVYLHAAWGLKGTALLSWEEIPTLSVILIAWSFCLAMPSSLLVVGIRAIWRKPLAP